MKFQSKTILKKATIDVLIPVVIEVKIKIKIEIEIELLQVSSIFCFRAKQEVGDPRWK